MTATLGHWLITRNNATRQGQTPLNYYLFTININIFTVWRYASAVLAMTRCQCLSLSEVSVLSNCWTVRAGFWHGSFLRHTTMCYEGTRVSLNIKAFVSETLSETLDLRTTKSAVLSTKLIDGGAYWPDLRRSTHRSWTHIVYYTSVDHNALTPLLPFVVDLLHNLFLQLWSSWQDFDWRRVARSVCGSSASCSAYS